MVSPKMMWLVQMLIHSAPNYRLQMLTHSATGVENRGRGDSGFLSHEANLHSHPVDPVNPVQK